MDAAEDALADAVIELPTVTFSDSAPVVFDAVDDCSILKVTVNNTSIFADNSGNETSLSTNTSGTAGLAVGTKSTVKVTYKVTAYPSITRTVTYTATVKEVEGAKSIEFKAE